jgi:glycosyltransferase involved in cell wall biosynthesis
MSDSSLAIIHVIGDCYVSLCRSEGFGLPIYEAFKYGKRIIATGYGGYMDFLTENHPGLVKFRMDKVSGMESFSKLYTDDAEWAIPDLDHASELMRKEYGIWSQVKNTLQT